ncbi:ADP-ribosylglycohydrolase family protein [uncultured Duncaniella sp.]|uniref:ADP-ribosylglycohydrolase family protein n=1 Tax=uncultured Duncaniella sp. TaxID=2768039 RepID=UPI0032204612
MLGAIIGDIVGSRYEFNPTNNYNFDLFGVGASFTDDTICTIAVADALLKGRDYGESIHEWCRRYPNPKGEYGGRFCGWVMSDSPQPYGSFGNGSAMRVSPVGWWFTSDSGLAAEARKTAECTHNHPEGIKGAQAIAVAISNCLRLRMRKNGKKIAKTEIYDEGLYEAISYYSVDPRLWKIDLDKFRNRFDETCQGTVPVALGIILNSTGFEDAIRKAVSLGADADTLGAIVGSIAEALWGIPEWMKRKVMTYLSQEMKEVVKEFHHGVVVRRTTAL